MADANRQRIAGKAEPAVDPAAVAPGLSHGAAAPQARVEPPPVAAPQPATSAEFALSTDDIVRQAKAMRQGGQPVPTARAKTCLVVDDSRVVRKVASKIVAALGYRVIEAENGEEGLARCRQQMPDLVLTDWQMPVMSGPEFVTALRAIATPKAPTVVFCTQMGEASDIFEGIRAGADDYIVKPFDEEGLRVKLAKLGVI